MSDVWFTCSIMMIDYVGMFAVTSLRADVAAWYEVSIHSACEACFQTSTIETTWAKNYREVCEQLAMNAYEAHS